MEKAKLATDTSNVRAYIAEQITSQMDQKDLDKITISISGCQGACKYSSTVAKQGDHQIKVSRDKVDTPNIIDIDSDVTIS